MPILPHPIRFTLIVMLISGAVAPAAPPTHEEATAAMHRAVAFFRTHCSAEGGYVYRLSADLSLREGEGAVGSTTAWIQPPGTPAVGMAYLDAYLLTGDPILLEAALETAEALIRGQLISGGWDNMIEFAPADRARYAYRVDVPEGNPGRRRNTTTFDDDKSQSAIRFLMRLDEALKFQHAQVHEAALYALDAFVKAQYPNGAWPQRYNQFPNPEDYPIQQARFPESWSRDYPGEDYKSYYTLNDSTISDLILTMLDAWDVYQDERYRQAALHGGDFLLLAQLPDPQPGWAQQYDRDMQPAWARKFEPPALTGSESQAVMQTLLVLYRRTQDQKYLEPIPRALKYYRSCLLPEGGLARFYEIETNRPLYFTKEYELTYSDDDLPTHYGFKVGSKLDRIETEYERLLTTPVEKLWNPKPLKAPELSDALARDAQEVIDALDERGAWVEKGEMRYQETNGTMHIIESRTFCDRLLTLARYVAATK